MTLQLFNGVVASTPTKLTDKIKVSVPDLSSEPRFTYGPLAFDPIVSGQGGTRLPHTGDTAVVGVDDETGESWVVRWHRDDTTVPPYSESGGSGSSGPGYYVFEQPNEPPAGQPVGAIWIDTDATIPTDNSSTSIFANVRDPAFGAIGNGIVDDSNALQAALNDGRIVYLPPGTYLITKNLLLRSGLIIFGCGPVSIIKLQANVAVDIDMLSFKPGSSTAYDIVLSSFVIDGDKGNQNAARQTTCVNLTGVQRPKLIDMTIRGGLIEGAYLYQCSETKIIRTNASGDGNYRSDASGLHLDTCDRAYLGGNVTDSNGFHGLIFTGTIDSVVDGHWSKNNGFDGGRFQYSSNRNRFHGFISDTNFRGMYFTTDSTLNHVDNSSMLNAEASGLVFNNAYANQFTFVHVQNCDFAVQTVTAADINSGYGNTWRSNRSGIYSLVAGSAFNAIAAGAGSAI